MLTNPDAVGLPWLLRASDGRCYWPRTLLDPAKAAVWVRDEAKRDGPPFENVAVAVERDRHGGGWAPVEGAGGAGTFVGVPLDSFPPFVASFPAGYAYDHPNETSAYMLGDLVVTTLGLPLVGKGTALPDRTVEFFMRWGGPGGAAAASL
jgi:hypothetical protein